MVSGPLFPSVFQIIQDSLSNVKPKGVERRHVDFQNRLSLRRHTLGGMLLSGKTSGGTNLRRLEGLCRLAGTCVDGAELSSERAERFQHGVDPHKLDAPSRSSLCLLWELPPTFESRLATEVERFPWSVEHPR